MRLFYILILGFFYLNSGAQHPYFYTLNDEDGLPSNEVYQVIQDDFGFIWIGCDAGLFRYDGFNFKNYQSNLQSSRSISNLRKDKNGVIWCQNFTGQIFHVSKDTLHLFHDAKEESRHFPSYTIDSKNRIWIANDNHLLVLSEKGKMVKEIDSEYLNRSDIFFNDIEFSNSNVIYAGLNTNEYLEIDSRNFKFRFIESHSPFTMKNNFLDFGNRICLFKETNPERKYFLSEIHPEKGEINISELPMKDGGFNYSVVESDGNLLLCNSDGIYVLNEKGIRLNNFPTLFEGQKISSCFKDKEGNLWVTSLQDGIFIIPDFRIGVINKANSILSDNNISSLFLEESDRIIFGTYSGLIYRYFINENKLELIKDNSENKYRAVRNILENGNELFVARGLFCILSEGNEKIIPGLNNCRDFILNGNRIFFITNDRLGYYDLSLEKINILREKGGRKVACNTMNNEIYFGCDDGLFLFKNEKMTEITNGKQSIHVSDLSFNGRTLWAATHQHDIFKYENQSLSKWNHDTKENIGGIKSLLVKNGQLFYTDINGLSIHDLNKKTKRTIDYHDGLAVQEINDIILIGDKIVLATLKGLMVLPFNLETKNEIAPSISIISVKSDQEFIRNPNEITIDYGNQNLNIHFIATAFKSRGKFHYKYRINDYSEEWVEISSNSPELNIPFLPSGDYVLEVIAVNEDGISSNKPAKITIHVNAPFWEKWWFYVLIFVLSIGIAGLIFFFRIRYLQQKAKAKHKVLLSQLSALKAQMNPHFLFNTLNSIQALVLEKDIKNANYYLSRFSTLTRKILAASDSNDISLEEEISILELYLEMEKLRFGDDFKYEIKNLADGYLKIPSMIIQPYVENALKHGLLHKKGDKKLDIIFEKKGNQLICIIDDNGVGRLKAMEIKNRQQKQHSSFATRAIEKRISLLNESRSVKIELEIKDKSENDIPTGTTIIIRIPYVS